jgi:hypothetical protein
MQTINRSRMDFPEPPTINPADARAQAIRETCFIADKPHLAADFIASGKTTAEVTSELRAAMPASGSAAAFWKPIIAKLNGRA